MSGRTKMMVTRREPKLVRMGRIAHAGVAVETRLLRAWVQRKMVEWGESEAGVWAVVRAVMGRVDVRVEVEDEGVNAQGAEPSPCDPGEEKPSGADATGVASLHPGAGAEPCGGESSSMITGEP